jgi:hypothetical protein
MFGFTLWKSRMMMHPRIFDFFAMGPKLRAKCPALSSWGRASGGRWQVAKTRQLHEQISDSESLYVSHHCEASRDETPLCPTSPSLRLHQPSQVVEK